MPGLCSQFFASCLLGLVLLGCAGGGSQVAEEKVPEISLKPGELPLKAFAALPLIEDLALSPSGQYLAFIQNTEGHSALVTQDRSGKDTQVVLTSDNHKFHISGFTWVSDRRLLVRVWYPDRDSDLKFTQTRLLAVDRDGSELKSDLVKLNLPVFGGQIHIPQFQDTYALIPGDDRHVLLTLDQRRPGAPDVYRLDVYSGDREMVAGNPGYVKSWLSDLQGRVRIGVGIIGGRRMRVIHRPVGGEEWDTLWEFDAFDEAGVSLLGFDADPDVLYLQKTNQDKEAIFKIDLSQAAMELELVYADPDYDVDGGLIHSAAGDRVLGVRYTAAQEKTAYWNESARQMQSALDRALPGRSNRVVSSTGSQHIVYSSGPTQAPEYYWMDTRKGRLGRLIATYPLLNSESLVPSQVVHFNARDGLNLEGYLTRPVAVEGAGPAIVFPHGGPWSRDSQGFNFWIQFLANRGWTVLQLNFRGSEGYGAEFETAGFQRWGLEMQDDITDGAHWLIEQKIADPTKICIVGGSYGGYAALMGAIKN